MYYVYVLNCRDKKRYIGCTNNLVNRIERHKRGYILATKRRLPIKLIYYCAFLDKIKAFEFEKYLKTGSGRAFIKRHF